MHIFHLLFSLPGRGPSCQTRIHGCGLLLQVRFGNSALNSESVANAARVKRDQFVVTSRFYANSTMTIAS